MRKKLVSLFIIICTFCVFQTAGYAGNTPNLNDSAYSRRNVFAQNGFGGQCTAFCYGRALEKLNISLPFRRDAYTWWTTNTTYSTGSTPRNNSIAVWSGNGTGHVAFVEEVVGSVVYFNEANWNTFKDTKWGGGYDGYVKTLTVDNMHNRDNFKLAGYIYLEDDLDMSKWRVTATEGINIRSGAGTGYSKVGALAYNTYFYITERKQSDGYIWGKTDSGWVALTYAEHVSGPVPDLQTDAIEPIHKDSIPHVRNGYCTIKNVSSGKFMNVYAGNDANYTSVCMWAYDDSTDQHFRLEHKGDGKYKMYAYCSSRGTNRVVDINRGTDDAAEGDKVQLWTPDDDISQLYYLWPVGDDEYVFELASKPGYVIAPNGSGEAAADGSQLTLQRYSGAAHQKWKFCDNNGDVRVTNITYAPGYYTVNTGGTRLVRRNAPGPYADVLSGNDINNGETVYVSQVNDFWGYTEFNGVGGWICLDYTKSTVVLDSISISSLPDKTSYFVGEQFDSLGLKISANYSNGQSEELTTGFTTSVDFSTAGTKNVTVSYKGKTTSFSVNVENIAVSELAIQETTIKKTYNVGEVLDTTGLSLIAVYNNGETVLIDSGFSASYDFSTPGTKTVTISYGGKSTSYNVIVEEETPLKTADITISSAECESGNNAVIYVSLTGNDIYDGNMTIQFDSSKLTINDVQICDSLKDRTVAVNNEYANDKIRISFSGTSVMPSNCDILRLEFSALNDAEGYAYISIAEAKLYDMYANAISTNVINGSVDIYEAVEHVEVTNLQSEISNRMKMVTANVSDDNVICYLAAYDMNGNFVECDVQQPENGRIQLSVKDGYHTKFMVWSKTMRPLINVKTIY